MAKATDMTRRERENALFQALEERILLLDGAMGTSIQGRHLTAEDFGGASLEGCNENLNLTRPDVIEEIHRQFLEAGTDILETNTFGGTPLVLREYALEKKTIEINRAAARIARQAADRFWTPEKPRFVAGSMGPTTKSITVTGGATFEEMADHYYQQAKGLHQGGVDYFLLETCQDTRNAKAGIMGIQKLFDEGADPIPFAVSGTIEASGTMLAGQTIDAFWASLAHLNLLYMGLNCATGPEFMTDHLRTLSTLCRTHVACVPNAGLPDEDGRYLETPEMIARVLDRFASAGWVNLIGGCCGTTPAHIERLVDVARKHKHRAPSHRKFSFVSGIDFVEIEDGRRPLLVGERTNVIGSRRFKDLIVKDQFEAGAEIARRQIRGGAQVIDVCLANPDRNEWEDMRRFLEKATKMVRAPIMIDSTDARVIAMALTYCQGKAIINSINLEDGEERFEKIVPLARQFGAALVVGCIDDDPKQGMAITRRRKLEVALRSHNLLTEKYGIEPEDIFFDALVFPCGTGDSQYVGSAVETIEGVRRIKKEFPDCKTLLGISNVSFGLPTSGREVLNSVFLYHCVQAGLDLAIVNTELLQRYPSISPEEKTLAENLLWNRGTDPIAPFAEHFRGKKVIVKKDRTKLSLDERLAHYIIEGSKDGLIEDLEKARKTRTPLDIINGPLMKGMDEVGRLFNKNELIVAEVLQSAEAMKAAVAHLETFMEKNETAVRGKVLLATVKGDVHDIGKNLVEIILSNNGFEVVNLGIKVPPEQLIAAVKEHHPHIIGLSGLLVKSAQQMEVTAEDLSRAGVQVPMLVGGAALTRSFTDRRIAKAYTGTVAYASDAMNGLELAKIIVDPKNFESFKSKLEKEQEAVEERARSVKPIPEAGVRSNIQPVSSPPSPPDFDRHVLSNTPLEHIWSYINPRMLFGRHLGLQNSVIRPIEQNQLQELRRSEQGIKALEILEVVDEIKQECKRLDLLKPKAVYRFFRAAGRGNELQLYDPDGRKQLASLEFPRQGATPYLSLPDYVHSDLSSKDNVSFFVVTSGHGVRDYAERLKKEGHYLKSHALSALALESAEGYAEWLHAKIRSMWGLSDPTALTKLEIFQAHYPGRRYSFGYPACPDLAGQKVLFDLLQAEEIGVELTEGFMMDPEASVSALVFHHPEATYFSV
ncbi:MAG TPA: methionine synthase [Bdellovibrionota bacterium]|nr:methionine synthase [Bdellovibrionota bacterium]